MVINCCSDNVSAGKIVLVRGKLSARQREKLSLLIKQPAKHAFGAVWVLLLPE